MSALHGVCPRRERVPARRCWLVLWASAVVVDAVALAVRGSAGRESAHASDVRPLITAGTGRRRGGVDSSKLRGEGRSVRCQLLRSGALKAGALLEGESRRESCADACEFEHRG